MTMDDLLSFAHYDEISLDDFETKPSFKLKIEYEKFTFDSV